MKTFEDYQEEFNGYCYKDTKAFIEKSDEICYIPESAESLDDVFNYSELLKEVEDWKKDNEDYFVDTTIEEVLNSMFECLNWEFPSSYLNQFKY